MQQLKKLSLLIIFSGLVFLLNIEPAIGLFDATLNSIGMVNKSDFSFMDANGLRVRKVNRTQHVITGPLIVTVDVGNEYSYVTYTYKKSGNDYKKLPYKVGPLPFCKYFDEEKFFVDTIRKYSDIPPKGTCPWPKGRYTVNNYYLNLEKIPPVFSTGEYKLVSEFHLDGKFQNGLTLSANLVSVF